MAVSPSFVVFAVFAAIFAWAQWDRSRIAARIRAIALLSLVAGLFLIGQASPNRESLSVHLLSLGADPRTPAADALIVGDHHDYADFVVMPFASDTAIKPSDSEHHDFVTVSTAAHTVLLKRAPGDLVTGRPAMVVAWRAKGTPLRFEGAVRLGNKASICLDRDCAHSFAFDAGHWQQNLQTPGADATQAGSRHYYFQRVFRPAGFEHKQSVIFYAPDGHWYLLPLDSDVRLQGAAPEPSGTVEALAPGKPISVSIFRLDMPDPDLDAPIRLVSRQSLTVADTGHGVYLTPNSPLVASAGTCASPRLSLTRLSTTSRVADYGTPETALIFPAIGNGSVKEDGSYRSYSPMNRADDGPLLGGATSLCDFRARDFSVTGQRLTMIKSLARDDIPLTFSIQSMRIPWLILAFVAFGLVVTDHFAGDAKRGRAEYVLVGMMQFLLAMRIVIGVRGTLMDPQIVPSDVFSDVSSAFVGLPVALIGLRTLRDLGARPRILLGCALATAFLFIWLWTGSLDRPFLTVMILAFGCLAWPAFARAGQWLTTRVGFDRAAITQDLGSRLKPLAEGLYRHHLPAGAIAVIAGVAVLRYVAFAFFGIRERAIVAVSLPYLALLLPGLAFYLAYVGRSAVKTTWQAVVFGGLMFLAIIVVPSITRDHGFAIVETVPIAALVFVEALRWREAGGARSPVRLMWMAGLPAAIVLFTGLLWVYPYLHGAPPASGDLLRRLDYALKFNDSNDIRLLHQFHGDLVSGFATKAAVANTQFWLDLQTFTGSLTGTGYLTDQGLGAFGYQALHFSDNLSAVHIMHPFGRIGAAIFLAVLILSVHFAMEQDQGQAGPSSVAQLTARLALWTLVFAAIYMILANLGWVPFTGRNIYLLAVSSGSDLAEGFMLLAMAVISLRRVAG